MRRILGISVLTLLLLVGLWSVAPAQVMNAITPTLLQARAWTFTGVQKLQVNSASLDGQTGTVAPGSSATLDVVSGFNHVQPTSVDVQSGCLTYDFALYPDDGYTPGEELLLYAGQSLNLHDGAPPMLRDDDLTGEVHARFWNRGAMGCTFRFVVTGGGF